MAKKTAGLMAAAIVLVADGCGVEVRTKGFRCNKTSCSGHGVCIDSPEGARCECEPDFVWLDPLPVCRRTKYCEGETCSGHGTCIPSPEQPFCRCDPFHVREGLLACVVGPFAGSCAVFSSSLSSPYELELDVCTERRGLAPEAVRESCTQRPGDPSFVYLKYLETPCNREKARGRCLVRGDETMIAYYYTGDEDRNRQTCQDYESGIWQSTW